MMNEKQICAGNIGDITVMCRSAMLPMMKRGNEAIGSKVNFPLENYIELPRSTNFCIQFMCQKGSTFLAIVTPSNGFVP
jgi:hypothetical protein